MSHRSPGQLAAVACWLAKELYRRGRNPRLAQLWITPHEAEQLKADPHPEIVAIDPITCRIKLLGATVRVIGEP